MSVFANSDVELSRHLGFGLQNTNLSYRSTVALLIKIHKYFEICLDKLGGQVMGVSCYFS